LVQKSYTMKNARNINLTIDEIISKINDFIAADPNGQFDIAIGTDSQNFSYTKIVTVIAVHNHGKGGIYFYNTEKIPLIRSIQQKLYKETELSLSLVESIFSAIPEKDNIKIQVHVDAGYYGKTKKLIPELTAWVKGCGYDVKVKPYSFAASSIANKYSK